MLPPYTGGATALLYPPGTNNYGAAAMVYPSGSNNGSTTATLYHMILIPNALLKSFDYIQSAMVMNISFYH